jgi:hypothetical protein|tara:strand:- start:2048 stop:2983 length:936 start_codon:yes stop_codon:yes gene_type:complete
MSTEDKRSFEVNGKTYAVRVPTVDEIKSANEIRAKTFNESLSRGDLLREQLEGELRKRKLWNDQREQTYQTLRQEVIDGEFKLKKGGIKLSQAKQTALEMADKRGEMVELLSSRTDLDSNTCEGKADSARFNYLFACCLVYDETGEPYFPNKLDDYLRQQDDPVVVYAATEFYYLISGSDNIDEKLPENQFLKKFKFVDSQLRLIDEDGRLVNQEGRHVDEQGNLVRWNKDGTCNKIDTLGRVVNEEGDFDVEHSAFLDDTGKPIDENEYLEESEAEVEVEEEAEKETKEVSEKPKRQTRKRTKKPVSSDN